MLIEKFEIVNIGFNRISNFVTQFWHQSQNRFSFFLNFKRKMSSLKQIYYAQVLISTLNSNKCSENCIIYHTVITIKL